LAIVEKDWAREARWQKLGCGLVAVEGKMAQAQIVVASEVVRMMVTQENAFDLMSSLQVSTNRALQDLLFQSTGIEN